jgi:hypothetical protein
MGTSKNFGGIGNRKVLTPRSDRKGRSHSQIISEDSISNIPSSPDIITTKLIEKTKQKFSITNNDINNKFNSKINNQDGDLKKLPSSSKSKFNNENVDSIQDALQNFDLHSSRRNKNISSVSYNFEDYSNNNSKPSFNSNKYDSNEPAKLQSDENQQLFSNLNNNNNTHNNSHSNPYFMKNNFESNIEELKNIQSEKYKMKCIELQRQLDELKRLRNTEAERLFELHKKQSDLKDSIAEKTINALKNENNQLKEQLINVKTLLSKKSDEYNLENEKFISNQNGKFFALLIIFMLFLNFFSPQPL